MTDLPLLKRYRFWAGSIAALASAITFALNVVFSRVAYDYGANIHALNLIRTATFLCCLATVVFMTGSRVKMPTTEMLRCLFLGLLLCAEMYLLLASILFIPVALAILVFYAYPLMIALWAYGIRKSPFSVMMFAAMALAFCGLVIALTGDDLLSVGWQGQVGIGLAAFAGVCLAALLVLSEKVLEKQNINVMMFYMLLSATGTVLIISVAVLELHWPRVIERLARPDRECGILCCCDFSAVPSSRSGWVATDGHHRQHLPDLGDDSGSHRAGAVAQCSPGDGSGDYGGCRYAFAMVAASKARLSR